CGPACAAPPGVAGQGEGSRAPNDGDPNGPQRPGSGSEEMQVRAFVRSDSRSAQLSTPIVTVARMMAEQAVRVLPVADGERFVGLVTDWDISCRAVIDGMDLERATVRDVMPDGQPRCTGNTELEQAVAMLDSAHAYG